MMLGEQLAVEAKQWVIDKVPYEHRGMTKKGCDCTGFLIGILQNLGYLTDFKMPYYPSDWNLHSGATERVINFLNKYGNEVDKNALQAGDILVFKFGRAECHTGIFLENYLFAHSYQSAQRCNYGVLKNSLWARRHTKTYRLNGELLQSKKVVDCITLTEN